jgi:hypothetical protein
MGVLVSAPFFYRELPTGVNDHYVQKFLREDLEGKLEEKK